jgi:WD40 repeat protein
MPVSSPLLATATAGCCLLIDNFLTPAECAELIASSERDGYASAATDYPPSYRNNHRHVIDSEALATLLGPRLREHAPASIDADERNWRFDGINARWRFCRYSTGQRFNIHQDGVHHRGPDQRSHLTVLIYLTDGAQFSGGDTVFHAHGPDAAPLELGRVRPRAGSLLLFDHSIWHAGDEVTGGIKHVLRSDVMYRAAPLEATTVGDGAHRGYVWTLAALGNDRLASGGRDATIRIQNAAGAPLRQLHGHTQSVLGLALLPGERLASVSRDRTLRIWHWPTATCLATVAAHDTAVLDVIALPGAMLATAGADNCIKLWREEVSNIDSNIGSNIVSLAGHTGWVWQLAPWNDGQLASASEDGTVRIWDTATGRTIATLEGDQPLRTLAVAGGAIWTGDIAGRLACWTCGPAGWTRTVQFSAHRAAIRRVRDLGAGRLASCGEDGALRIWDTVTCAELFAARHDNFVTDAVRCGGTLLSSAYDGRIARHDWREMTA